MSDTPVATSTEPVLTLNGRAITTPAQDNALFNMLLWGKSGCGKTTLASTAPGRKLYIMFDPKGHRSLIGRKDVFVIDLSGDPPKILDDMKKDNPLGIEQFIRTNNIDTVILDSLTVVSDLALEHAVKYGKFPSATLENPGKGGYGHRGSVVLSVVKQLLRSCHATNTNCVLIAHEDLPTLDDKGAILYITIMLGGKTPEKTGLRLDEIWHVSDTGTEHRIAIRPSRGRVPMKTRMFKTTGAPEFKWKFNPEKWEGDTIEEWVSRWQKNGFNKLELPT